MGMILLSVVVAVAIWLGTPGGAFAADRHLHSGLAYLRAGAQAEAERDLTLYRDAQPNPEIRRKIDRVLPLLKRPLTDEVREYVAFTIEDAVPTIKARSKATTERGARPSYWSRMFPVFH